MQRYQNRRTSGFTLVEMAIVLGIAGLLFGGLWRLLSTGNQQMRDQATSSQHTQLIGAISTYLQSTDGQHWMSNIAANSTMSLPLPTAAAGMAGCAATLPVLNQSLCNILPPGFVSTTTTPYGQLYSVSVLKDNTPNTPPTAPMSYSFMVLTTGGDTIPDTSGGRISAMIGGDGGFVYSNNVCGNAPTVASWACGSFGSWSTLTSAYGLAGTSGHVASRTYYSPFLNLNSDWLARVVMPSDPTYSYNTMQMGTPFLLGDNSFYFGKAIANGTTTTTGTINMQGGTIYLADPASTTATGQINLEGGTVNVQGGVVALGTTGTITGTGNGTGESFINLTSTSNTNNPLINLGGSCTINSTSPCEPMIQLSEGDIDINNGVINSQTFTYSGSDLRLKTNIKALADPLADIMKLKPVSFAYRANGKESIGVIAQDIEQVYPQLVIKGHNGMRAVAYDGLIAPLIGSIQELKRENDALRLQLRDQAARQDRIEQEREISSGFYPTSRMSAERMGSAYHSDGDQ